MNGVRIAASTLVATVLTLSAAGAAQAYVPNPEPYPSIVASFPPASPPVVADLPTTGVDPRAAISIGGVALVAGLGLFALRTRRDDRKKDVR